MNLMLLLGPVNCLLDGYPWGNPNKHQATISQNWGFIPTQPFYSDVLYHLVVYQSKHTAVYQLHTVSSAESNLSLFACVFTAPGLRVRLLCCQRHHRGGGQLWVALPHPYAHTHAHTHTHTHTHILSCNRSLQQLMNRCRSLHFISAEAFIQSDLQ